MTCDEAEILLHALIDGELDAGHAREVENHIAGCPRCAAALRDYREMSKAIAEAGVRYTAPRSVAQAYRGLAAAAAPGAEPARGAARLCDGLGGVGAGGDRAGRDRAAPRRRRAHPVRGRLGASALAAGRSSHRRGFHRPAHRETVVQRQARRLAAGDRPHRAGLHPDRRPARLCRCPRHRRGGLSPPPARHQPVRVADIEHRTPRGEDRTPFRASTSATGAIAG